MVKGTLVRKILTTVILLAFFRAISLIPVPFVDVEALQIFASISLFSVADEFNGGTLSTLSLTAVGISSYVTSSIIIQLLSVGVPTLEEISKMPGGQKVIKRITICLGIILSLAMSFGMTTLMGTQVTILTSDEWYVKPTIALFHCVGTVLAIFIGETISEKGFGNGVSLLIAMNIAISLPKELSNISTMEDSKAIIVCASTLAVLILVTILELTEIRVPITYSKNISVAGHSYDTYLPVKLNIAGVMPIIFATTLYQIVGLVIEVSGITPPEFITTLISYGSIPYISGTIAIVFLFTFFYSALIFRTDEIAKGLQINEGFIPGIRPGTDTEKHLAKLMHQSNVISAICMSVIILIPMIIFNIIGYVGIQPTSMIILSGVALEILVKFKLELQSAGIANIGFHHYRFQPKGGI